MTEFIQSHGFELSVILVNGFIALVNKGIGAKLKAVRDEIKASQAAMTLSMQQLETRIFERFLTKDDYYAHQKKG